MGREKQNEVGQDFGGEEIERDRQICAGSNIIQPRYQCLPKHLFSRRRSIKVQMGLLHFINNNELAGEDKWCFAWLHDKEISVSVCVCV